MTSTDYCEQMSNPRTWGGGPEIVALSNHFRCPIHVYQLSTTGKGGGVLFSKPPTFSFELCAKFGSPQFDNKTTIYLLCADGRYRIVCLLNYYYIKYYIIGMYFVAIDFHILNQVNRNK